MADETRPEVDDPADTEVAELLIDIVAMLCKTENDNDVSVKAVPGYRSVTFVVDLVNQKHRAMFIGKEGKTVEAIRHLMRSIGGANKRRYFVDLGDRKEG